ncbi:MAG: ABC transporter ATP-binding protein [Cyanobium sp. CACIAM 14]|nr:MAG: ABC transporter ATP-binding protein [Cyanobium sp. CACIAM 14]
MPRSSAAEPGGQALATGGDVVLDVQALHRSYGSVVAVRGVDFEVRAGEIFGLIGADGAGKTSTFHILAGMLAPSAGTVRVLGQAPRQARSRVGYLTQTFSLYPDLSVVENLRYVAGLRRVAEGDFRQRRQELLKLMGLAPFGERLAGQLSGGMKQKLALCCALIDRPQVLLLDEPTTGVDPVSRREFWDVLARLAGASVTILVATPYLDEAERCHRIALIHEGRIRQIGTPAALKRDLGLTRLELRCPERARAEALLEEASGADGPAPGGIVDVQTFGDRLDVLVSDAARGAAEVRGRLAREGLAVEDLQVTLPTLENVFVTRLRQEGVQSLPLAFPRSGGRPRRADPAIAARALSRSFGGFQAVRQVDLEVGYGEIFGLLGANGAGKTTTIKMLCGLLEPSAGEVSLAGETSRLRSRELLGRIGYMSQRFTLYDDLSIRQNLAFYAGVYGIPRALRRRRIDWVLASCGLEGQGDLPTGQLPGGWKQRVAFGAAVLHDPQVLFLDEPTSGVDPVARRQFWRLINAFARSGTAILVTTHYLEEAEQCNRLCFLVAGRSVIEGTPSAVKAAQPGCLFELQVPAGFDQRSAEVLRRHWEPWRVSRFADRLHLVLDDAGPELALVRRQLGEAGIEILSLRQIPFSLEDAFIGTVQRTAAAEAAGALEAEP